MTRVSVFMGAQQIRGSWRIVGKPEVCAEQRVVLEG